MEEPSDNIIKDQDPEEVFEIIQQIGNGSYGKVYKALNKISKSILNMQLCLNCIENKYVALECYDETIKSTNLSFSINLMIKYIFLCYLKQNWSLKRLRYLNQS